MNIDMIVETFSYNLTDSAGCNKRSDLSSSLLCLLKACEQVTRRMYVGANFYTYRERYESTKDVLEARQRSMKAVSSI